MLIIIICQQYVNIHVLVIINIILIIINITC